MILNIKEQSAVENNNQQNGRAKLIRQFNVNVVCSSQHRTMVNNVNNEEQK